MFEDLKPNVHVNKHFGEEIQIAYHPNETSHECSLIREMKVEQGSISDWRKLCGFHYRGHNVAVPRKIFRLTRGKELCGVIVYSYSPPNCYGRRMMLPRMTMREVNNQLSIINRVVIHPKYRTVGLGAKLIRETLPLVGTLYVEMIAVMAKYNPFAEKAGMTPIATQQSVNSLSKVSQALVDSGFNLQLLASEHYVRTKLENLSSLQTSRLKEASARNGHPRLRREFQEANHMPYGEPSTYASNIRSAGSEKLTSLIKLVGQIRQTKVYLFWSRKGQA